MNLEQRFTGYSRGLAAGIVAIVLTGTVSALTFESVAAGPDRVETRAPVAGVVDAPISPSEDG